MVEESDASDAHVTHGCPKSNIGTRTEPDQKQSLNPEFFAHPVHGTDRLEWATLRKWQKVATGRAVPHAREVEAKRRNTLSGQQASDAYVESVGPSSVRQPHIEQKCSQVRPIRTIWATQDAQEVGVTGHTNHRLSHVTTVSSHSETSRGVSPGGHMAS